MRGGGRGAGDVHSPTPEQTPNQSSSSGITVNTRTVLSPEATYEPILTQCPSVGLTPDGGHLTGGTAGPAGRMSVCRASVVSTPRSFGSRLPAW